VSSTVLVPAAKAADVASSPPTTSQSPLIPLRFSRVPRGEEEFGAKPRSKGAGPFYAKDPKSGIPSGTKPALDDEPQVRRNVERLKRAWRKGSGLLWGDKTKQQEQLRSRDPAVRAAAISELEALEDAVRHTSGKGDPSDYALPPEVERPPDSRAFTHDEALAAILEQRRSGRLKQLNEGALRELPDDRFTADKKMQQLRSNDAKREERKVVTVRVTLEDGEIKVFRLSISWYKHTGQFGDAHDASGPPGKR
jgi:hypothetical protein